MVSKTSGEYKCIEGPRTNFSNFVNLPKGKIMLWCQFVTILIIDNPNITCGTGLVVSSNGHVIIGQVTCINSSAGSTYMIKISCEVNNDINSIPYNMQLVQKWNGSWKCICCNREWYLHLIGHFRLYVCLYNQY